MTFEDYLKKNKDCIESLKIEANRTVSFHTKLIDVNIDGRKISQKKLNKLISLIDKSTDVKVNMCVNYRSS